MTRAVSLLLALVGLIGLQPSPPLTAGEPFHVLADHQIRYYQPNTTALCPSPTGCVADTTSYNLRIDGTVTQTLPASANTTGTIDFAVSAGLNAAMHTFVVEAVGGAPQIGASVPLSLTIDPAAAPAPGAQGAPSITRGTVPPPASLTIAPITPWVSAASGNVSTPATQVTAGDFLIAPVVADTSGAAPTVTLTSSPALTWTRPATSGGANTSTVQIWVAPVLANASVTVTASVTGSFARAVQLYRVTGQSASQPIGAIWQTNNTATTNAWTPTGYTTTAAGSIGFAVIADYAAQGAPTSTDLGVSGDLHASGTSLSWIAVRKATGSTASGQVVTFNAKAPGTISGVWRGVGIEVRPQ